MTFNYTSSNLYNVSNALNFGIDTGNVTDPFLLRGKTALKSGVFPYLAELLLTGRLPNEAAIVKAPTFGDLAMYWGLSVDKPGNGKSVDIQGAPSMMTVLPAEYSYFQTYEMSRAEYTQTTVAASAMAYSSGTVTFYVAATSDAGGMYPVDRFQIGDIIKNWSHTAFQRSRFRVTAVSIADNSVTVVAYGNTAAVTQIIDVFSADATADRIQIVGNANDKRNSALPSARVSRRMRTAHTVKRYYMQTFETMWEEGNVADPSRHYLGNIARPEAYMNSADALHAMVEKISGAFLWGTSSTVAATSDMSGFQGIDETIVTNVTTLSDGLLSFSVLDKVFTEQLGMQAQSRDLYGFCSPNVLLLIENLFNSLANQNCVSKINPEDGMYKFPITRVRYRNFTLNLMPLADFINTGNAMEDLSTTVGVRRAGNLYIVDPAALHVVVGSHMTRGPVFFSVDKNVETKEENYYFSRHALRTSLGFCLRHEWTSAVIKNIQGVDILG
jgi:hypothetical protein